MKLPSSLEDDLHASQTSWSLVLWNGFNLFFVSATTQQLRIVFVVCGSGFRQQIVVEKVSMSDDESQDHQVLLLHENNDDHGWLLYHTAQVPNVAGTLGIKGLLKNVSSHAHVRP